MKPNTNQTQAIAHDSGPLLIVAGAGTGKTTTLVEKIKHLILEKNVKPEEILCLTFTEKSAHEMEERVDVALPYGYFQLWISTFHSFADEILRTEIHQMGMSSDYTLMTEAQTLLFLKKHLFSLGLDYFLPRTNPTKFLQGLVRHFSRLRDEDVSPQDYKKWVQQVQKERVDPKSSKGEDALSQEEEYEKYLELANAYKTYQQVKEKENCFDFDDLVYYLLKLFHKRPSVLQTYRDRFKHVMVDEFQDTNIAQYELIKLLCEPTSNPNLTVVGDDSQAIYKFRGASVSNIMTFMLDYPSSTQISLTDNYRSNQTILDHAYKLIQHNNPDTLEVKLGISKELKAHTKDDLHAVRFRHFAHGDDEADWISKEILTLQKKQDSFSDIAILVRAHSHAEPLVRALSRNGIPYQILGPGMLLKQPEVKDLVAYIYTLTDLEDTVSFYRVLSMNYFGIDEQDLILLLSFSKRIHLGLYQTCEVLLSFTHDEWYRSEYATYKQYLPLLKKSTKDTLQSVLEIMKNHLKVLGTQSAGEIVYSFLEDSEMLKTLSNPKNKWEEKRTLNITSFFNLLKKLENSLGETGIFATKEYLEMSMNLGESPRAQNDDIALADAVNVLTIHSAKGLEFPVVFLANLVNGRFPTRSRREQIPIPDDLIKETLPEGDFHVQEERRLCYVAFTRAKNKLYLSSSNVYGEGVRKKKISSFVTEAMGEKIVEAEENKRSEQKAQLSIFDFKPSEKVEPIPLPKKMRTISFSQLQTYEMCPLRYKYQYVLKIPTPPNDASSFGSTIHRALQEFYKQYSANENIDKSTLLNFVDEYWIPVGYRSRTQELQRKKEAKEMLEKYFDTFHTKEIEILSLEQMFKITLDQYTNVSGKIDRVDKKDETCIEIIDYKTGSIPNEKTLSKNAQLSIYALAAKDPQMYHKKIDEIDLTFHYLQGPTRFSIQKTESELEEVKDHIIEIVQEINAEKFEPVKGPHCSFCPFKMICEAWQ